MKRFTTPFDRYIAVMTPPEFERLEDSILAGRQETFSNEEISDLELRLKAKQEKDNLLYRTAERNNRGMYAESERNIDLAIKIYEENIADGYPATHSYDRLMILYRRAKQYQSELRVINRTKEIFGSDRAIQEKMDSRKTKALHLLQRISGFISKD